MSKLLLVRERFDSPGPRPHGRPMSKASSSPARDVVIREVPIELCQFIKFGGLADSGGAAKQLVAEGAVLVNGEPETRKRKQLVEGDRVSVEGQTIVVRLGTVG
jgi:ribosome-associated protein